jgi:hypothetical protein
MPCAPAVDKMNTDGYNSLISTKTADKNTLCDSWYTVFRRNSRFIQDKSVAGNAGVAGCPHKKGRNYELLINQRNGRKMGRIHNFNQEIV